MRGVFFLAATLLSFLVLDGTASAATCGCQYQDASSESPTGTCAVREDMTKQCLLVWGTGTSTSTSESSLRIDHRAALDDIVRAAANSSNRGTRLPEQMQSPEFWSDQIRKLPGKNEPAANFDHALAFLSDRGATLDFREPAASALLYLSAVLLQGSRLDANVRQAVLSTLLEHQNALQSFSSQKATTFKDVVKPHNRKALSLEVRAGDGCFDMHTIELPVAILIKAQWSRLGGKRC